MTNMCSSSGKRYAQAGVQFACASVPVIRSSAIGCMHSRYMYWMLLVGGLHSQIHADTAAAEARSIDAVDRAASADDVNRKVSRNLHLRYQQMCRNLPWPGLAGAANYWEISN